jgi:hypothetical protein
MKQIFIFLMFLGCFSSSISAQEDNLIYKFKGLSFEPSKDMFITLALQSNDSIKDAAFLSDIFDNNQNYIRAGYDEMLFEKILGALAERVQFQQKSLAMGTQLVTQAINQGVATYQKARAEEKAIEAQKQAERKAFMEKAKAKNHQKAIEFENMTKNGSVNRTSTPDLYNHKPINISDLYTADGDYDAALQMEAQIHGEAYVRQKVKERRNNAIAQSKNSTDINKPIEYEKVITAVTESRTQLYIKIKVGYIIGYSRGLNQLGKHDWTFVPNVSYTKTFQNREFAYTANVGGTRIYFNL